MFTKMAYITPYLDLCKSALCPYLGKPLEVLEKDILENEKRIRTAIVYPWGNTHITYSWQGVPVLSLGFDGGAICIWKIGGNQSICDRSVETLTQEDIDFLETTARNVYEGNLYCDICEKWYAEEETRSYSYAGVVCKNCFDAEKHRPPDSSG